MKNCINCNAVIDDTAIFCQRCGAKQELQNETQQLQPNQYQPNQYQAQLNPYVQQYSPFMMPNKKKTGLIVGIIVGIVAIIAIIVTLVLVLGGKDGKSGYSGTSTNDYNTDTVKAFFDYLNEDDADAIEELFYSKELSDYSISSYINALNDGKQDVDYSLYNTEELSEEDVFECQEDYNNEFGDDIEIDSIKIYSYTIYYGDDEETDLDFTYYKIDGKWYLFIVN